MTDHREEQEKTEIQTMEDRVHQVRELLEGEDDQSLKSYLSETGPEDIVY